MLDPFLIRHNIGVLRIGLHGNFHETCCTLVVLALEELIRHLQEIACFFPLLLASGVVDMRHVLCAMVYLCLAGCRTEKSRIRPQIKEIEVDKAIQAKSLIFRLLKIRERLVFVALQSVHSRRLIQNIDIFRPKLKSALRESYTGTIDENMPCT